MRVLIDALSARFAGSATYASNQIAALVRVRPRWYFKVLVSPRNLEVVRNIPGIEPHVVNVTSLGQRLTYEQCVLPWREGRRADVIYYLGNFVPLVSRSPSVVVQQSVRLFGAGRRPSAGLRHRVEVALANASVRRADAVIVISDALLKEMGRDGLALRTCEVVHSGAPEPILAAEKPEQLRGVDRYFLSVAVDYPYKRLDDLVQAWGDLLEDESTWLVLAGAISRKRIEYHRQLVRPDRRARLVHLGQVEQRAQLRWLYERALALVVASELEAYSLTPSEAGAFGCPLVLSDIPAHREVSLGHGSFFPVGGVGELADILARLLSDPPARDEMWAWPVTWDMNAEVVAEVLERVAKGRRPRSSR